MQEVVVYESSIFVPIEDVLPTIQYMYPNVEDARLRSLAILVINDIATHTGLLTYTTEIETFCGIHNYLIPLPVCVLPYMVNGVWSNGIRIDGVELHGDDRLIIPNPRDGSCVVEMRYKLSPDACEIPAVIWKEHILLMTKGMQAEMLSNSTSTKDRMFYEVIKKEYESKRGSAAVSVVVRGVAGKMKMKTPRVI